MKIPENCRECPSCLGRKTLRGVTCDVCEGEGYLPDAIPTNVVTVEPPINRVTFFATLKAVAESQEEGKP